MTSVMVRKGARARHSLVSFAAAWLGFTYARFWLVLNRTADQQRQTLNPKSCFVAGARKQMGFVIHNLAWSFGSLVWDLAVPEL